MHWITFDCRDPYELGGFWAQALGGRRQDDDLPGDPEVLVTYPVGTPLLFQAVPEPKQGKNRLHLDLQTDLPRDEQVERLVALGATVLDRRIGPDGSGWVVMADPEGNEFCVERSEAERAQA